jgi:hypothetical protein
LEVSKGVDYILRSKILTVSILLIAVVSISFNVSLWKQAHNKTELYNYLVYTEAASNLRSNLQIAAGTLDGPNLAYVSSSVYAASNDMSLMNDALTAAGVQHVLDISSRLEYISLDFKDPSRIPAQRLASDKAYVEKVYNIFQTTCNPNGKVNPSAFPSAFEKMYAIT